jgi:NTP pyrophosphatase (non-canonical NTP hydrolase)
MALENLTQDILKFVKARDWAQFHSPKNMASAINVEAGELLETIIWTNPTFEEVRNDPKFRKAMEEELADILIYALEMYHHLGVDPEEAIRRKIEVNAQKYPIEKARGNAKKYSELDK